MATPERQPERDEESGQFEGHSYNRLQLFEIAREIAEIATRPGRDARKTTQAAWLKAKARSKWPDAPSPDELCQQLRDRDGKPYRWRKLLADVCGGQQIQRIDMARSGAAPDPSVDSERIFHALRRVAAFLGLTTLLPDDYSSGRAAMIAKDKSGHLETILPTVGQIGTAVEGDWSLALEWAELDVAPKSTLERAGASVALPELICRFYEETRQMPAIAWLGEYASDKQVQLARREPGKTAADITAAGAALVRERVGVEPTPYSKGAKKPLWSKTADRREGEAPPRDADPLTEVRATQALLEFLVACRKRKLSDSLPHYKRLTREDDFRHWPAGSSMQRRGSWRLQIAAAQEPGALVLAAAADLALATARTEKQAASTSPSRSISPDSPRSQALLAFLRAESGPLAAKELRAEFPMGQPSMSRHLVGLREAGLVRQVGGGRSSTWEAVSEKLLAPAGGASASVRADDAQAAAGTDAARSDPQAPRLDPG